MDHLSQERGKEKERRGGRGLQLAIWLTIDTL